MSGTFVAVVGPSGVGKDSLIAYARERLVHEPVTFVRRVVTRAPDGGSEDHDSLDPKAFADAEAADAFALSWEAHGLRYGLPARLDADLAEGKVVVANLSRAVLPMFMGRYPTALVVNVTADRDVIEQRLAGRGRESGDSIRLRLGRRVDARLPASTIGIDNSGPLEIAGEQFVALLRDVARTRAG